MAGWTVWVVVTGTNYVTVGERSTAFMVISNPVPTSQHSQGFCYLLDLGFPGEQRHPKYKIVHLSISPIPFLECSIAVSASARLSMEIAIHQHFSRTIFVERWDDMFHWATEPFQMVNFMRIGWIDGENILNILLEMNLNWHTVMQWYTWLTATSSYWYSLTANTNTVKKTSKKWHFWSTL